MQIPSFRCQHLAIPRPAFYGRDVYQCRESKFRVCRVQHCVGSTQICMTHTPGGVVPLSSRELLPVISSDGNVADASAVGRVGVFAVFNDERKLVYVGISRDCGTSLRKSLARRPMMCAFYVAEYVTRPSRTALEAIRSQWVAEWETTSGESVCGCDGGPEQERWESAIDVRQPQVALTEEEQTALSSVEPSDMPRLLKKICRRVQADIEGILRQRGLKESLKFAPKLKEKGLLDVESVKRQVPETIGSSTILTEHE